MRRACLGLTILEMVVVMSIAAGASAVALPKLAAGQALVAVQASGRELASALRIARADAVALQREVAWRPDADGKGYRVDAGARSHRFPDGVQLRAGEAPPEIRFFADGTSTGGRIALAAGSRSAIVEVDWITGRVRQRD